MRNDNGYSSCTTWRTVDVAMAWHREGRLSQAAVLYQNVLFDDETNVGVLHLLGMVHSQQGDHTNSAKLVNQALSLYPTFALENGESGSALSGTQWLADRSALDLETNRLLLAKAAACANLGLSFLRNDQFDKAWRFLSRATKLRADWPAFWEYLADFHSRLEQHQVALRCWNRVLELAPDHRAWPHIAMAHALEELSRNDEAGEHYETAIAVEPNSFEAHAQLGEFLMVQGRMEEAEVAFRTVLRLQPTHTPARARLVQLSLGKLTDNDLNTLQTQLEAPETDPESRTQLLFTLGMAHDARGEYTLAARRLRAANTEKLALIPAHQQFQVFDHHEFVSGLITAFGPDFFARTAGAGLNTKQLVFIVGLPRSGTTLLEQVLSGHPRVHGAGELRLARGLFDSLPMILDAHASPLDCVGQLDTKAIHRLARSYLSRLQAMSHDRTDRIIDKQPENYYYLGLLGSMFPEATIIHCRRDLRDVALSCWMTNFQNVFWAHDPVHIATIFQSYLQLMEHWRTVLPARIHAVNYEALVADLEGETRSLLAAMQLEWDPACLDFQRTRRPVRTASLLQVRQPISKGSVGRWKSYEQELADLFAPFPATNI